MCWNGGNFIWTIVEFINVIVNVITSMMTLLHCSGTGAAILHCDSHDTKVPGSVMK